MVTVGTDEGAGRGRSNLKTLVREERAGGVTQKISEIKRAIKEGVKGWPQNRII